MFLKEDIKFLGKQNKNFDSDVLKKCVFDDTGFFCLPHQANIRKIFLAFLPKVQFSDLDLELPNKITHLL